MKIAKVSLGILAIPITYLLVALIISLVSVNGNGKAEPTPKTIFLSTNGVHLDIILPKEYLTADLLEDLSYSPLDQYFAFGWGDENFYLNTPTWADMTLKNATQAMLWKSSTLVHLSRYQRNDNSWTAVKISDAALAKINAYLQNAFQTHSHGRKMILAQGGYGLQDDFYKAKGSYSCFYTCNTWVNAAFKESGLKACLWTPYDFALLNKYKEKK